MAPVKPGLQPLQIIEERQLAVAVCEPKLENLGDEELKKMLKYCFLLVGIRGQNIPQGPEKEFLHRYIRQAYGRHTASEVRLAFDMAVQGRLGLKDDQITCFENFSVLYFATIMNAYRRWASENMRRLEAQSVPEEVKPTADQIKKIEEEYLDFTITEVYKRLVQVNKLPTTVKLYHRWQKASSRTK